MIKKDLIERLRAQKGFSKANAEALVSISFDEIIAALIRGDRVEIRGLCSIYVKEYKGYGGRKPKTGALKQVAPKKLRFFKAGKGLKERVGKTT